MINPHFAGLSAPSSAALSALFATFVFAVVKGSVGSDNILKRIRQGTATAGILLASLAAVNAQDFGLHFLGSTSDPVTNKAGVVPIGYWNNIAPGAATTTITGSDGVTTAAVNLSGGQAANAWHSGLAGDGADQSLMDGYLDAGSGNNPAIVTISNLPGASYNVYIYNFPDQTRPSNGGDLLPNYSVNGTAYYYPVLGYSGSSTYDTTGVSEGGAGFVGFIEGTYGFSNSSAEIPATSFGNYIVITNVATLAGAITIVPEENSSTWRSPLNGVELVAAANFGVHFLGNTTDDVTNAAGVVAVTNWNNIPAGAQTTNLTGSDGTTQATLNLSGGQAANAWDSGLTGDGGNLSLMDGFLDAGAYGGSPAIITISNLDSSYYNVYLYTFTDQSRPDNGGDWLPNYAVNGITYYTGALGNTGSTEYDTNNLTVGGDGFTNFIEGTLFLENSNSKINSTNFGNYIEITTVEASGGVITVEPQANGTTWRSPLNGIELVPTAAPAFPILTAPMETPSTANQGVGAGTTVTLGGSAIGEQPISFQWQTDGGTGLAPTNIPGATATNLMVNTAGWLPGTYIYDYVASNSLAAETSSVVSITVAATSPTAAISVQFQGNSGSLTLAPSQVAGVVPHANWNIDTNATGVISTNLVDSTGTPTGATIEVTYANGQYHSSDATTTADDVLMSGGFWSGAGFTVNATGIPYSNYNVYVYMLNDNNPNRRYGLTLDDQTYWGGVFNGNIYNAPPFTPDTQTTELPSGTQMQADLVEFGQVTGSSFTITGQTPDGTVAMMGLEIVNPAAGPALAQPIDVAPSGEIIYQGDPVTLTEYPYGATPLSYQWETDNGTGGTLHAISGATNSTLSVNTSSLSGNYSYQVIVSNASGSSISPVTTVAVATSAPVLVTDISPTPNDEAYTGETVTYSPAFGGSQPISYQWMVDMGSGLTNIPGATNSTLVLSNVQISESGTYSLTASNSLGSLSTSSSALTVFPDPLAPAANSYGAAVLAAGPLAYWRFNEDADPSTGVLPAYDSTGHGFIGVYGPYSQNGFDGIAGPQPPAFPGFETNNFALGTENDLTNSLVTIPALDLDTTNVTITMWIFPMANEPASVGLLMNRPFGAGLGFGTNENVSGMAELGYTWNTNAASTWSFNSGLYPPENQWSFVALVVEPSAATLYLYYIDPGTGLVDSYSAVNAIPHGPAPFNTPSAIGTDPVFYSAENDSVTRTFTGSIDEVAVYTNALSSTELESQFAVGTGLPTLNIIKGTGRNLTVTWTQTNEVLLESTNIEGPWITNSGASSPFAVLATNSQMFFKVVTR